jgi:hypothetical protein
VGKLLIIIIINKALDFGDGIGFCPQATDGDKPYLVGPYV